MRKLLLLILLVLSAGIARANNVEKDQMYKDSLTIYEYSLDVHAYFMEKVYPFVLKSNRDSANLVWDKKIQESMPPLVNEAVLRITAANKETPEPCLTKYYFVTADGYTNTMSVYIFKKPTANTRMEKLGNRRNYTTIKKDYTEYYTR